MVVLDACLILIPRKRATCGGRLRVNKVYKKKANVWLLACSYSNANSWRKRWSLWWQVQGCTLFMHDFAWIPTQQLIDVTYGQDSTALTSFAYVRTRMKMHVLRNCVFLDWIIWLCMWHRGIAHKFIFQSLDTNGVAGVSGFNWVAGVHWAYVSVCVGLARMCCSAHDISWKAPYCWT